MKKLNKVAAVLMVGTFVLSSVPAIAGIKDEIKEQTKELEKRISELETSVSDINSKITDYYESIDTDVKEKADGNEAS